MDLDSDRTVDSDELEDFINKQKKSEHNVSSVAKSKIAKSTSPCINAAYNSDSNDNRVEKKQKKITSVSDSDTDRTVDSDELEEFIARSQNEIKSSRKVSHKKGYQSSYKEVSDSEAIGKRKKVKNISNIKPQSSYKGISDSDDEVVNKKKKHYANISSRKPTSSYKETLNADQEIVKKRKVNEKNLNEKLIPSCKEISDCDSDHAVKKQKVSKNISNIKPRSNYKDISDSDDEVMNKKKKHNENISSKKTMSSYKEISDSDSDHVVKKKKVIENISNIKPQSSYKVTSDSDSDDISNKKRKKSKNISNKKPLSSYKEISDSDSDHAVKEKVSESISYMKPQSSYKEISDSDSDPVVKKKVGESIPNKKPQPKYKEISDSDSDSVVKKKATKIVSVKKREKCKYGKNCYRKNPDHIKNFDHGCDTDALEQHEIGRKKKNIEINLALTNKHQNEKKSLDNGAKHPNKENSRSSKEKSGPLETKVSTSSNCKNYHFYLTKVNGIPNKFNCLAYDIKDILSFKDGTLISSAQFNYLFDIPWLIQQYPEKYRKCPLTIVHGEQKQSKKALEVACASFPNIKLCQAKLDIPFGTHHTKMMFLLYKEGFKIVIHTSNIVDSDWAQRTQGMWISPMLPELKSPSSEGESPTNFKADLLDYVTAYGAPGLEEWLQVIKKHDFSAVRVVLIGSVPGRFVGSKKTSFGHLRLRKVLNLHGSSKDTVSSVWPIICQFSSIGSLGASPDQWMTSEFGTSLSTVKDASLTCQSSNLKLVFPTVENVRKSLQGYPAGASLPYSIKVAQKQPYLKHFMHQWKSDKLGRSEASPHIKTYLRLSPDNCYMAWFLLTSANLSKAAWGALEKKDTQLMIRSYELGVLFLPKFYGLDMFSTPSSVKNDFRKMFPVPYDIPLEPYAKNDVPWIWDIPHIQAPDRFGQMWCPPPLK